MKPHHRDELNSHQAHGSANPAQVKELFGQLMDATDESASDAHIRKAEAAQALAEAAPDVRAAAESLVKAHSRATGRLLDDSAAPAPTLPIPQIQNYTIRREIGRGGFGIVYEAEQLHPVQRDVALKVLRADVASDSTALRFRTEAAVLARLQHPGIASVFDAGFDSIGRAYLAVELIRGEPITTYCARTRPSVRERVRLMAAVCDAVHHAHQRAVLHRDIKPANILVQDIDGVPAPQVIDFGIAKLIDENESEQATLEGHRLGTPKYMGPELLDGSQPADIRADVFALGMVLCEALSGALPDDGATDSSTRTRRPSLRTGWRPSAISAAHQGPEACRPSELRGDLDRIVLKATARDPAQRYNSAAALAEDLQRYLRGEPVRATPPHRLYLMRKFIGRHPIGVTGASVAAAVVLGALVIAMQGQREAEAARGRAVEAAERAERVSEFILRDMVAATDPVLNFAIDREPTIADLLGQVESSVNQEQLNDPRMRFDLLAHAAIAHSQLRQRDDALRTASAAIDVGRTLSPTPTARMLELELTAIDADRTLSREDASVARATLLARATRELGDSHPVTIRLSLAVSRDEQNDDRRLAMLQQLSQQTVDAEVRYYALEGLAGMLRRSGRLDEELIVRQATLEAAEQTSSRSSTRPLGSRHQLAMTLAMMGRMKEAQETLEPLLRFDDTDVRMRHPGFVSSAFLAVRIHQELDEHDDAIALAARIAADQNEAFGEHSFEHVAAVRILAQAHLRGGHPHDAIRTFEEALILCDGMPVQQEELRADLRSGLANARAAATQSP